MKIRFISVFVGLVLFSITLCQAQGLDLTGGELKYGENEFPGSFDPITSVFEMSNVRLVELLFESLLTTDELDNYIPQLAADMPSINGKKVQFKLKNNVTWHDGIPFTSKDVKFTFDLLKNNRTIKSPYLSSVMDYFVSCTILSDFDVKFVLKQEKPEPYSLFRFKIVPEHAIGVNFLQRTNKFVRNPIGTGPYKFYSSNYDTWIRMDVNESYIPKRSNLDRIRMEYYADPQIMYSALIYKGIDAVIEVRLKDLTELETSSEFYTRQYNSLTFNYIGFNLQNKILNNKKVRQAICLGIDRAEILAIHYFNKGELISGPFPPASPYNNPEINVYPFLPDVAKRYLQEVGCKDNNGDGVLELNGQPLDFEFLCEVAGNGGSSIQSAAEAIKDYLKAIGIQISIKNLESQAFNSKVFEKREFDMVISGWTFDEENDISSLFHTNGANNFISYSNPKVDKYIDYTKNVFDEEKKRLANYELHKILQLECPYCFLWTLDRYAALNKKIRGTEYIHPFRFFTFINNWYIPRELQ